MLTHVGMRHAALPVTDLRRALSFYQEVLGFKAYHISDQDWAMVCLHGTSISLVVAQPTEKKSQGIHPAHLGITVSKKEDVDAWHNHIQKMIPHYSIKLTPPKLHRDGSYGFYFSDPDQNALELIFIPLIAQSTLIDQPKIKKAILLFAHGSRLNSLELEEFKLKLMTHLPSQYTLALAFLEFQRPTLEDALLDLRSNHPALDEIQIIPLFLVQGTHLTKDLPELIKEFQKKHPEFIEQVELNLYNRALTQSESIQEALLAEVIEKIRS